MVSHEESTFFLHQNIPEPTFCPDCRLQRRLAFRNERALYRRTCDLCHREMISMYAPNRSFNVYCPECFYSDRWDPLSYGRAYDFDRTFFDQWISLQRAIPHLSLLQEKTVNSPWINYELDAKNCYLNFGGQLNEDSAYNQYLLKSADCFDNYWVMRGTFCYESVMCENAYKTWYSTLCYDSRETYFSFDCRGCDYIIGCSGLRHKQYQIFNRQVTPEEFQKYLAEHPLSSHVVVEGLKHEAEAFRRTLPQRAVYIDSSVHCSGNFIKESKNCLQCWNSEKSENTRYGMFMLDVKDSMDVTSVWWGTKLYEFMGGSEQLANIFFSTQILRSCRNIEYSHLLFNCANCFGCINMRNRQYCVLNQQYSEDEYRELTTKIRQQMMTMPYVDHRRRMYKYGEFFPYDASPFGYNETVAIEYFPIDETAIRKMGYRFNDYTQEQNLQASTYLVPDDIRDVGDDILEKVLTCEVTGKHYRIIPMELDFYRRFGLPIPRRAPFERHRKRVEFIGYHRHLYVRNCAKCDAEIHTAYLLNEFPLVYCEDCYRKEFL